MLDSTDFDHSVGEIELQTGSRNRARRHRQVHAEYSWFFANKTDPKGKMTAYFELFGLPTAVCT